MTTPPRQVSPGPTQGTIDSDTAAQHCAQRYQRQGPQGSGHVVGGREGIPLEGAEVQYGLGRRHSRAGAREAGGCSRAADAGHPLDAVGVSELPLAGRRSEAYPTRSPSLRPELSVPGPNPGRLYRRLTSRNDPTTKCRITLGVGHYAHVGMADTGVSPGTGEVSWDD